LGWERSDGTEVRRHVRRTKSGGKPHALHDLAAAWRAMPSYPEATAQPISSARLNWNRRKVFIGAEFEDAEELF
jgi:hypothetical protein